MSELGYTQQELDNAEARKIGYLLDLASAKQAAWMNDVALAVYQGKETSERIRKLTEGLRNRFEPEDRTFNIANLKALAYSGLATPEASKKMLEQIKDIESGKAAKDKKQAKKAHENYLAFCKATGREP